MAPVPVDDRDRLGQYAYGYDDMAKRRLYGTGRRLVHWGWWRAVNWTRWRGINWTRWRNVDWSRWGNVHWAGRWSVDWSRWRNVHWAGRWSVDWSRWGNVHWAGRWSVDWSRWRLEYRTVLQPLSEQSATEAHRARSARRARVEWRCGDASNGLGNVTQTTAGRVPPMSGRHTLVLVT